METAHTSYNKIPKKDVEIIARLYSEMDFAIKNERLKPVDRNQEAFMTFYRRYQSFESWIFCLDSGYDWKEKWYADHTKFIADYTKKLLVPKV